MVEEEISAGIRGSLPVEHVGDHFDFCFGGGEFFRRGGLGAAGAEEVGHGDGERIGGASNRSACALWNLGRLLMRFCGFNIADV